MPPADLRQTLDTIAKTLRQSAFWADHPGCYIEVAEHVEAADAESLSWCCPVCEETTCDEGCPLAAIRRETD